jgi:phenylalanyl-tRNA synthetase beta chain
MLVSWNWLQDYIGATTLTAQEVADLLGTHAFEIEGISDVSGDTVIDVDVLPNRSSDCLSHRGIAREVASITNTPLAHDPLREPVTLREGADIAITIEDAHASPRFSASLITGVSVKESPEWLQARLRAIGQRSINNIVDATNYVMFALGQPIHAYDADLFPKVDGLWKIGVRFARPGETVSLLPETGDTERVVECLGSELLIVDGSSDTAVGLAGVKGGSFAGIHRETTAVIIETAHFHPTITRQTARRLGIVIDASKRFENEPSRELIPYTQQAVCDLIVKIAGGTYVGTVDEYLETATQSEVFMSLERTNTLLGLTLSKSEVCSLLERIGAQVVEAEDGFLVTGPWERTDLLLEADLIEEVGRLHGYEHITAIQPSSRPLKEINKRHYYSELIRHTLLKQGYSEIITSSFRKKDEVQLRNALASDKSCLRSDLTKSVTETLDKNAGFADLLGTSDTRVFEIGTVFHKRKSGIGEHVSVAFGVRSKPSGYSGKEDTVLKETLTLLSTELGVDCPAELHQGVAELNLTTLLERLPDPTQYAPVVVGEAISYRPFSVYPHMSRDIAIWVEAGTTPGEVEAVLNEHAGDLRVRTTLFDEFTKEGRTSVAFRLVFQAFDRTLTDEEVNQVMEQVYSAVKKQGWEVR